MHDQPSQRPNNAILVTPLYKYMSRAFARALVRKGDCRIGTLLEFQGLEQHGPEIGDEREGTKSIHFHGDHDIHGDDPSTIPDFVHDVIDLGRGGVLIDCDVTQNFVSPNEFIFSASRSLSIAAMRSLGYDTVVKITHPGDFVRALTPALHSKHPIITNRVLVARCVYRERDQHYVDADDVPPALLKSPRHAYQDEVRVIWSPVEQPIEPIIVDCPAAASFCRFVSDGEMKDARRRHREAKPS